MWVHPPRCISSPVSTNAGIGGSHQNNTTCTKFRLYIALSFCFQQYFNGHRHHGWFSHYKENKLPCSNYWGEVGDLWYGCFVIPWATSWLPGASKGRCLEKWTLQGPFSVWHRQKSSTASEPSKTVIVIQCNHSLLPVHISTSPLKIISLTHEFRSGLQCSDWSIKLHLCSRMCCWFSSVGFLEVCRPCGLGGSSTMWFRQVGWEHWYQHKVCHLFYRVYVCHLQQFPRKSPSEVSLQCSLVKPMNANDHQ